MNTLFLNGLNANNYHLVNSDNLIVARTHHTSVFDHNNLKHCGIYNSFKTCLKPKAHFPEANVFIYEIENFNGKHSPKEIRDVLRSKLKEEDHIKFAGKVLCFKNSNIYQIYTENLFLKFRDDAKEQHCKSFLNQHQLKTTRNLHFCKNGFLIKGLDGYGKKVFDIAETLLNKSIVELCHPELVTKRKIANQRLNDFKTTNTLSNHWTLQKIKAEEAWKKSRGEGIKICIIDDGIEINHPAFANKIYKAKDMLVNWKAKNSVEATDPSHKHIDEMHGTACASIACANTENIKGVAPKASLMPIRSKGLGSVLEAEAFYWAVNNGADVISCSWGPPDGDLFSNSDDALEYPIPDHTRLAIDYAATKGRNGKGSIILFAAGNGREPIKYDGYAAHPKVMAIGASNKKDKPALYSDYGNPVFCVFPSGDYLFNQLKKIKKRYGVEVADRIGAAGYSDGDYYDLFVGTSASSPGVAGIVALILSIKPELSRLQVKEILKRACDKIGNRQNYRLKHNKMYSNFYGYGLLRADKAVNETLLFKNKNY